MIDIKENTALLSCYCVKWKQISSIDELIIFSLNNNESLYFTFILIFFSFLFPKNKFLESCIPVSIEVILLAFFLLYGILNYGI